MEKIKELLRKVYRALQYEIVKSAQIENEINLRKQEIKNKHMKYYINHF